MQKIRTTREKIAKTPWRLGKEVARRFIANIENGQPTKQIKCPFNYKTQPQKFERWYTSFSKEITRWKKSGRSNGSVRHVMRMRAYRVERLNRRSA